MLKYLYTFIFLLGLITSHAQNFAPGGVQNPAIWLYTKAEANKEFTWISQSQGELPQTLNVAVQGSYVNFNPSVLLNAKSSPLALSIDALDLQRATFFTIFDPIDLPKEQYIWSYQSQEKEELILTTHRMADIKGWNFMNFQQVNPNKLSLSTYVQSFGVDTIEERSKKLLIGGKPIDPSYPLQSFAGNLPELIVYDRILDAREKLQVESYLALKYGLSLTTNYLNADGALIWDHQKYLTYSHGIAGIVRDDKAGLNQKQASSQVEESFFTMGLESIESTNNQNKATLPNQSFLLWGHNQGGLSWSEKSQGQLQLLNRQWLLAATGQTDSLTTMLHFEPNFLRQSISEEEIYWLAIDRSGTGNYPVGQVDYFPAKQQEPLVQFEGIQWDLDQSDTDIFTLGKGPQLFAAVSVIQPQCVPATAGTLLVEVHGGQLPYQLALVNQETGKRTQINISKQTVQEIPAIQSGTYTLFVQDTNDLSFQETLTINALDAPRSNLDNQYELMPGTALNLDAALGMSDQIQYSWQGENGITSNAATISIDAPGEYQLTLDQQGCKSTQTIQVVAASSSTIEQVDVFPNPTKANNAFQIKVLLEEQEAITVEITDILGRSIKTTQFAGNDHYLITETLQTSGAYYILIHAGNDTQVKTLVIQ